MSAREGSQRGRGARRAGRLALAPVGLSEERALSPREGSQRGRGARRAGRLAAPRGGAGMVPPRGGAGIDRAPVSLSEERALSGPAGAVSAGASRVTR